MEEDNSRSSAVEEVNPQDGPLYYGLSSSSWTLFLSLVLLWIVSSISHRAGFVLFPLLFAPLGGYILWWSKRSHLISLESILHAFSLGFYPGGLAAFILQVFLLIVLGNVLLRDEIHYIVEHHLSVFDIERSFRYYFFFLLYALLPQAIVPECLKYVIASGGRYVRDDIDDVRAYLFYSTAGALGLSTFHTLFNNIVLGSTNLSTRYEAFILRILINTPIQTVNGYLIGIGVAKREARNWDIRVYQIIAVPVFVSFLQSFQTMLFLSETSHPTSLWAPAIVDVVILLAVAWFAHREQRDLPSSFVRLPSADIEQDDIELTDTPQRFL